MEGFERGRGERSIEPPFQRAIIGQLALATSELGMGVGMGGGN
jgi:hypothetical protein